jgi:hypothetical protein
MDFNKRRESAFERLVANKPELDRPSSCFLSMTESAQRNPDERPRLTTQGSMENPDLLLAEGRLGSSENASKPRRFHFFVACLALFAYIPLV